MTINCLKSVTMNYSNCDLSIVILIVGQCLVNCFANHWYFPLDGKQLNVDQSNALIQSEPVHITHLWHHHRHDHYHHHHHNHRHKNNHKHNHDHKHGHQHRHRSKSLHKHLHKSSHRHKHLHRSKVLTKSRHDHRHNHRHKGDTNYHHIHSYHQVNHDNQKLNHHRKEQFKLSSTLDSDDKDFQLDSFW
ncbi:histidine-rich glycoprotein-like [Panonychus citri]|uniref:histidine-rich glycoprotein-like n=1 Tax=Panonychus citri TaxID=50023 RepID=UPI0023071421|nr:histidine-rich glycoprotein-like [Panonychus citri]